MSRTKNPAPLLTTEGLGLLSLAAMFDGAFSLDWILELSGAKASQALQVLEESVAAGRLERRGTAEFTFADVEARDQLRRELPEKERQRMHQRIAELLLRELSDEADKADAVAHHLLEIRNDLTGCTWLKRAGDVYLGRFQTDHAAQCYMKALDDLYGVHGEETDSLFIETTIQYSKISVGRHQTDKVVTHLHSALERASKSRQDTSQAILKMHLAKSEWFSGHALDAMRSFQEAWSMAEALGIPKLHRSASVFRTFFRFWQGRYREVINSYESFVPEVDAFPKGRFPLLVVNIAGHSYPQVGQLTQGLGLLHALREHAREIGDRYIEYIATGSTASTLMDIGRFDDLLPYLEIMEELGARQRYGYMSIFEILLWASWYHFNGELEKAIRHLQEFHRQSTQIQINIWPFSQLMEFCWAMEQGHLPVIDGLSLQRVLEETLTGEHVSSKGFAYRYKALLDRKQGASHDQVMESLNLSEQWLLQSDTQIELGKTRVEMARQYLLQGNEEKAREVSRAAAEILSPLNDDLIPDELRSFLSDHEPSRENALAEVLSLGQEVVAIRDHRELVQKIISTVNRLTGAERGAIFLLDQQTDPPQLSLKASKNLTLSDIDGPEFSAAMETIREVARSGEGRIVGTLPEDRPTPSPDDIIRSHIGVPMILRGQLIGVLYHDNRMRSTAFGESDLDLLAHFAAFAAFALDNAGAYDEIQKLNARLAEEKLYFEEKYLHKIHYGNIIGETPQIRQLMNQVSQVAQTESSVLILGETGVGKELVAGAIHRLSSRKERSLICVQCSALPESLIPSELFGHEKGAFTGAERRRIGRFELADGGTLFLDEIGDLPMDVQSRLLRVLETKEFQRVGGSKTLKSDFRLIAATNANLEEEVKAGRFRSDLYYRLNVFPLHVPPLRDRREDIPLLAHYFLKMYSARSGKKFKEIPKEEMNKLEEYEWPGNVRELENVIERSVILSQASNFRIAEFGATRPEVFSGNGDEVTLSENERRHILRTLESVGWKVRGRGGAAERLGVPASTLAFRMKKLGIKRPAKFRRRAPRS